MPRPKKAEPEDIDVVATEPADPIVFETCPGDGGRLASPVEIAGVVIPSNVEAMFDDVANCVTFANGVRAESISLTAPKELIRRAIARVAG